MKKNLLILGLLITSMSLYATGKHPNYEKGDKIINQSKKTKIKTIKKAHTKLVKKENCDQMFAAEYNMAFSNFNYLINSTSTSSPYYYEYVDYYFEMLDSAISSAFRNYKLCNM